MPFANLRRLSLVISCRSSIAAAPEHVDAEVTQRLAPLVDALDDASTPPLALHFGGYLLDRLARAHEGLLLRLKAHVEAGRVELLGGLFYGGPPGLLPESDVRGQLAMLGEFWESFVGGQPRGMLLPEGAWAAELPRLLEDTGVAYALLWAAQLQPPSFLGRVERGGSPLLLLGLHPLAAADGNLAAAAAASLNAAAPGEGRALRLEVASLGVGSEVAGRLAALGDVLRAHGTPALPRDVLAAPPPVAAVRVAAGYAPAGVVPSTPLVVEWAEFPSRFAEAQLAYRCMLRASGRLSRAIARMEDEGLDERWSDALATAQRLIFAAQGAEALGVGTTAGVLDPAVRDAALARTIDAERLLDRLVHGETAFLEVDESDVDGDLRPDVWLHGRAATAWLQPARGGAVRALEHRGWRCNVLDAGTRRLLPGATGGDGTLDVAERAGLRCALFADATPLAAAVAGAAADLLAACSAQAGEAWQVVAGGAEPAAPDAAAAPPAPYALTVRATPELGAHGDFTLEHTLRLPVDAFGLHWSGRWQRRAGATSGCVWALEVPLRLGAGALRLLADGATLVAGAHPLPAAGELRVVGSVGTLVLRVHAERGGAPLPLTVWWSPLVAAAMRPSAGDGGGLEPDSEARLGTPVGAALWLCCPAGEGGEVRLDISAA